MNKTGICYDLGDTTFCSDAATCEAECSNTKCATLSSDRLYNLFVYYLGNVTADLEAEYEQLGLNSLTGGFACNYKANLKNYSREDVLIDGSNVPLTFFTVPDCLQQCAFGCQRREVGVFGRRHLYALKNLRPLLLFDCAPPTNFVLYSTGISLILLCFALFVFSFWCVPSWKKYFHKRGDESEVGGKDEKYFKSMKTRKNAVSDDFYSKLSMTSKTMTDLEINTESEMQVAAGPSTVTAQAGASSERPHVDESTATARLGDTKPSEATVDAHSFIEKGN